MRVVALIGPLALAGFGAVGLLLADLGVYRPWLVLVLGFAAFAALYQCARPLLEPDLYTLAEALAKEEAAAAAAADPAAENDTDRAGGDGAPIPTSRTSRICSILAAVFAALTAAWNFMNAAQHAQINRDGGLYLNAGKWISQHGTLNLQPFVGPFANNPSVIATSTGMKVRGDHLEFDLSHMLSAVLAEAHNLGGNRLMFAAVPILSGFALLAFYRLAARLLQQPIAALGATATLALIMPQVSFSRDSTTEIPIQVLLFTALWMLCDRRTLRTPRLAFVAGFLLGIVQAIHIDGLVFIIGLPVVYAVTWLHTNRPGRRHLKRGILWSAIGVGLGILFGVVDLLLWDRYYLTVVRNNVAGLAAVVIVASIGAFALVVLVRRTGLFRVVQRSRNVVAYVAGGLVVIAGFGAWFVRPHIQTVHARTRTRWSRSCRRSTGSRPIRHARYAELSVRWMSWYVGPITVTLAILGAAGLAVLLVRGSLRLPVRLATFMLAPPALLYTLRPSITPDQIWATRRFLPVIFPVVILLAWAVIGVIAHAQATSFRRSFAIVLGLATVVFPVLTIRDVSQMTEQRNLFPIVTNACRIIGPHGAVVMLQGRAPESVAYLSDPQTIRSFCNVPVMIVAKRTRPQTLHSLAARWRDQGRRLFVVDEHAQAIRSAFPTANVRSTGQRHDLHILEQTLDAPAGAVRAGPPAGDHRARARDRAHTAARDQPGEEAGQGAVDHDVVGGDVVDHDLDVTGAIARPAAALLDQRARRSRARRASPSSVRSTTRPCSADRYAAIVRRTISRP